LKLANHRIKVTALMICLLIGLVIVIADYMVSEANYRLLGIENLKEFGEGWSVETGDETLQDMSLPVSLQNIKAGERVVIRKRLPADSGSYNYLFFRASHQFIKVSVNSQEVYSFGWEDGHLFGKTPGCAWIVVPVSKEQAGGKLEIEIVSAYNNARTGIINEAYIGDKSSIIAYIIKDRIISAIACVVILTLGFSMMMIAMLLRSGGHTIALFRLGALSVVTGIWSLCILNILQLQIRDVFFLLNMEFLTFTLLLPFFLWFLQAFDFYRKQKIVRIMFWISILNFILVELLQLLGIADYVESITMTHFLMGIIVIYLPINGIRELVKKDAPKEVKVFIATVIVLISFLAIDLLRFYFFLGQDEGLFSRIGLLVFVLLWSVVIIENMSKVIVENTKTKILEIIAYTDQMTGLKNRSAFEEKLSQMRAFPDEALGSYIITFDMNGLKRINDNYGHVKGDEAIIELANIIKSGFEDIGSCYRIGGDEICVVVTEKSFNSDDSIQSRLDLVIDKTHKAGDRAGTGFSVAGGFSQIEYLTKPDIDEAYKEADRSMYQNKEKMKSQGSSRTVFE